MRLHSKLFSLGFQSALQRAFLRAFLSAFLSLGAGCHGDRVRGLDGSATAPDAIEFGIIPVNGIQVRPLSVGNTSAIAVTVMDSQVDQPFGVESEPSAPVDPGKTQQMLVSFVPLTAGEVRGTLTLITSSIANPNLTVKLHGIAYLPELATNLDRLDFGDVNLGDSKTLTLTISNSSPARLNPNLRSLEPGGDYSVAPQGDLGELEPQQTVTVSVAFAPSVAGKSNGSVVLRCPVCVNRQIMLSGNGVGATPDAGPPPVLACALSVLPARVDFAQTDPGSKDRALLTLSSSGSGTCFVQAPYFARGTDPSFSTIEPLRALQLAPGQTSTLTAVFAPDAHTPLKISGSLVFVANDHNGPVAIALTGSVTPPPPPPPRQGQLVVAPASLIFTAQPPHAPAAQQLTVLNGGGQTLNFTAASNDPQMTLGVSSGSLAPGQRALINLAVAAQASPGSRSQTITVDALGAGQVVLPVQIDFTAAPPPPPPPAQLGVSPLALTFTAQTPSAPPPRSLTISNTGGLPLSWTGTSADAAVSIALAQGTVGGPGTTLAQISVAGQPYTGTRKSTLVIDAGAAGTATVTLDIIFSAPPPPPPPPQYGHSAWPKWHHGNTNTGLSEVDTSNTGNNQFWRTFVAAPVACLTDSRTDGKTRCGTYLSSPVLAQDGTVLQLGGDGNLYAFDPATGARKWSTPTAPPWIAANEGTPTVVADGSIFLMTAGEELSGKIAQFYKLDQNGNVLWHNDPSSCSGSRRCDGFDSSPALGDDGTLYFGNDDLSSIEAHDQRGVKTAMVALSPQSDIETQSGALAPDNIGYWSANGHLWALSKTATLWSYTDPNSTENFAKPPYGFHNIKSSPAVTSDGKVIFTFVYEKTTTKGVVQQITRVHAFQAGTTQKHLWSRQLGPTTPRPGLSPGGGLPPDYADALHYRSGITSPAIGPDGTIYVGHCDGLYALNSDGTLAAQNWPVAMSQVVSSPAVGADGTVYVGSMDGFLYAIHPDGMVKWQFETGGQVNSSPAIGVDGTIYLTSDDGFLYAIR